jgi:uncharacterized protein YlxP (DUF503 family)
MALDDVRTYTGTLVADIVLPWARGLKDRRGPLRTIVKKLQNNDFAVSQVGPTDFIQRAFLAVATVSGTESVVEERLDAVERILFASDFEIASVSRSITVDTFPSG